MTSESQRIYQLLENSWEGPMWHGGHMEKILAGIKWQKAFQKPDIGSHNIYELVMHMIFWRRFVLEHLKGNTAYKVGINSELDWPTKYERTETAWKSALAELQKNQKELLKIFKGFEDGKLDEPVPGKEFNWYIFIHGLIHHDIYHSAQISILKK